MCESKKNSRSISFVTPWQWMQLIIFWFLSLNIEPSHLFCRGYFQLLPLFLEKNVPWKGRHPSSAARHGHATQGAASLRLGFFSTELPLLRTPPGVEFLFTAWKLSILNTFGSFTERHFINSRFSFYHLKTSIKYAPASGAISQWVNSCAPKMVSFFPFLKDSSFYRH